MRKTVAELEKQIEHLQEENKCMRNRVQRQTNALKAVGRLVERWKRKAAVRGSMVETLCELIWKIYGRTITEKGMKLDPKKYVKKYDEFPGLLPLIPEEVMDSDEDETLRKPMRKRK